MSELLTDVFYLDRGAWDADTSLPRLGYTQDRNGVDIRLRKTEVDLHHSVAVDNDDTPEIWETLDEIKAKSRAMQVVRPDLGSDWPYNHGLYLMPNGVICIVEGRGYNRTGAHTRGHNTEGWGFVFMGNFEAAPFVNIDPWMPAINRYLAHVKRTELPNLIEIKTHREIERERGRNTVCPGRDVTSRMHQFSLEDDMELLKQLERNANYAAVLGVLQAKVSAGVKPATEELALGKWVLAEVAKG